MKNSDNLTLVWYEHPTYHNECESKVNQLLNRCSFFDENNEKKVQRVLRLLKLVKRVENAHCFLMLRFLASILMRLLCIGVLVYVVVIMIRETDSWLPLANLLFCFGIFADTVYFVSRKKEHTGINVFLFFYSLGMIPALWLQHEIMASLLAKYSRKDLDAKYASDRAFAQTKNFEIWLFGTLFFVRTFLPRKDHWSFRSSLDLMLSDIIYMTDSLDFSKILFDNTRTVVDKSYKNLVLWTLAFTSCFYCLNVVYKPPKVHIKQVYTNKLNRLERVELKLAHDPLIRFLVPNLFFEIPVTIARTIIFYGFNSIRWDNFTFLLKNIVSIILTMCLYFEIKTVRIGGIFFTSATISSESQSDY